MSLDQVNFLFKGLIIGFSIAAPVGPIGVLCIRRTLTGGRVSGLLSGLGAATADSIYGCIAGFGLVVVSDFLINQQIWLRLIGGLFLCCLGIKYFFAKPSKAVANVKGNGLVSSYTSTFILTLANPMTILSFAAIFAGLGLTRARGSYTSSVLLVWGVFLGSSLWWLILSSSVNLLHSKFDYRRLWWLNKISGTIIIGFGVTAFLSLI